MTCTTKHKHWRPAVVVEWRRKSGGLNFFLYGESNKDTTTVVLVILDT